MLGIRRHRGQAGIVSDTCLWTQGAHSEYVKLNRLAMQLVDVFCCDFAYSKFRTYASETWVRTKPAATHSSLRGLLLNLINLQNPAATPVTPFRGNLCFGDIAASGRHPSCTPVETQETLGQATPSIDSPWSPAI